MNRSAGFSRSAVALSVVTGALAAAGEMECSAREAILSGLGNALLLSLLTCLSVCIRDTEPFIRKTMLALLTLGLAAELAGTILQAQQAAQQEFRSMALVGLLPFLLLAGWCLPPESWNAPARVLWWFVLLGGAVLVTGLWGQVRWLGLAAESPSQLGGLCKSFFCAEFFLWPLLCPETIPGRAVCLPWLSYAVQAGTALGRGLLFGGQEYPAMELLRAWSIGAFSRIDALLILIWLACAVYRIGFLCAALRICLEMLSGTERKAAS